MSEVDERRIAEIAKGVPRVLRGGPDQEVREEARRVVEAMALMRRRKRGGAGGGS